MQRIPSPGRGSSPISYCSRLQCSHWQVSRLMYLHTTLIFLEVEFCSRGMHRFLRLLKIVTQQPLETLYPAILPPAERCWTLDNSRHLSTSWATSQVEAPSVEEDSKAPNTPPCTSPPTNAASVSVVPVQGSCGGKSHWATQPSFPEGPPFVLLSTPRPGFPHAHSVVGILMIPPTQGGHALQALGQPRLGRWRLGATCAMGTSCSQGLMLSHYHLFPPWGMSSNSFPGRGTWGYVTRNTSFYAPALQTGCLCCAWLGPPQQNTRGWGFRQTLISSNLEAGGSETQVPVVFSSLWPASGSFLVSPHTASLLCPQLFLEGHQSQAHPNGLILPQ